MQAVGSNLLLREKEESVVTGLFGTDSAGEIPESESLLRVDCLLSIVRALGMGSCLSGERSVTRAFPYGSSESPSNSGKWGSKLGTFSFSSDAQMQLHRVPGRMFLNGSSEVASMFCKQGKKGINQDAMLVWENFCSKEDTIFCGVFDGHGPLGHRVSKQVRDSFPLMLGAQLDLHHYNKDGYSSLSSGIGGHNSGENGFGSAGTLTATDHEHNLSQTNSIKTLKESILKACKVMDKELKLHPDIDCFSSGTTAVTVVKQGQDLVIGNIGDSRAVLGTRDHDGSLTAVQLTVDLKPYLPREAERIRLCKGRVFALRHEPQIARVWLPKVNSPGLAMTRAFGDFCLKDFGLISVPDISHHHLTEQDEFVVLASDGIWDVLSNKEVVDIVASASHSSAARILVESAVKIWRIKYPKARVDDCTAVCLFLDSESDFKSTCSGDDEMPEASSCDQSNLRSNGLSPGTVVDCPRFSGTSPENQTQLGKKGIGMEEDPSWQ